MGPLRLRSLGDDSALRLRLGVVQYLGLSALPVRFVELLRRLWLGLGARHGDGHGFWNGYGHGYGRRLRALWWWRLWRHQHRPRSQGLSSYRAPEAESTLGGGRTKSSRCDRREPGLFRWDGRTARPHQKYPGRDRRSYSTASASIAKSGAVSGLARGIRISPHAGLPGIEVVKRSEEHT